jgi:hypothetical protein
MHQALQDMSSGIPPWFTGFVGGPGYQPTHLLAAATTAGASSDAALGRSFAPLAAPQTGNRRVFPRDRSIPGTHRTGIDTDS